jgi:hypothetical protein
MPSWALPVGLAAASSARSWRSEGIAGRQNSSWFGQADAPAWSWLSVGGRCRRQVAFLQTVRVGQSCLGLGNMTLVGIAVGTAAAGGNNWGGEVQPRTDGRMVLCIPATNPPMMLARVALGLCARCQYPHVALVCQSSTSPPCVEQ